MTPPAGTACCWHGMLVLEPGSLYNRASSRARSSVGAPINPINLLFLIVIFYGESYKTHTPSHVFDELHWPKLSVAGTHPARRGFAVGKRSDRRGTGSADSSKPLPRGT